MQLSGHFTVYTVRLNGGASSKEVVFQAMLKEHANAVQCNVMQS
jgi:hypothetical protein